jgi:hypothetical protein
MGGDLISTNTNRWCSCRYSSTSVWYYSSYGCLVNNSFCSAFTFVPVCRLLIP